MSTRDQFIRGWACRVGAQRVVPVAVELVAVQDAAGFEGLDLLVGDLDAFGVGAGVEFGVDGQPGRWWWSRRWCSTMTSWLVRGRPRQFIGCAENSRCSILFHLDGAGREVADGDRQPGLVGQGGEFGLPQPGAVAVGAAAVGGDQQPGRARVGSRCRWCATSGGWSHGERGGVVVGAHVHPAGVRGDVVHPVRGGLAQLACRRSRGP